MLYTIVHTVINTRGIYPEANAAVLGIYSNEELAIREVEKLIENTKTSDVSVKRITDTQWYFWYEENGNTYGGYVNVYGKELDKSIEYMRGKDDKYDGKNN